MNILIENRIKEVIRLAEKLGWIQSNNSGYPLLQLSEVEKCMIAMVNQDQFNQMKIWCGEKVIFTSQSHDSESKK